MTDQRGPAVEFISLAMIDEPGDAMRQAMDEEKLHDLAADIKSNGLTNPLTLRRRGTRYEIVAGHRRFVACQMALLLTPPCRVYDGDDAAMERLKIGENLQREDINPVDEGVYYEQLLAKFCSGDVDELVLFVQRPRQYVETRLNIVRGDREVAAALRAGDIPLGVATELNRYKHDIWRRTHLDAAKNGATVKQVRQWRMDAENFEARQGDAPQTVSTSVSAPMAPPVHGPVCEACGRSHEPHRLIHVLVHDFCYQANVADLLAALRGAKNG